jgi:HlyD family secretion protein
MFAGTVRLVRLGAQTIQNVVTYTAVVGVDNRDMALLPGMTANLQIMTDERANALRVPNAALRFRPAGAAPTPNLPLPSPRLSTDGPREGRGGRPLQDLHERLARELRPTPEQSAAIERILADARSAARDRQSGLSDEERRGAMRQFRRDLAEKIAAVLDPERRARYLALAAEGRRGAASDAGTPGRVYVLGDDGAPVVVALRVGVTDGSYTEVLGGDLKEGDGVIIGGGPRAQDAAEPASSRRRGPRLF